MHSSCIYSVPLLGTYMDFFNMTEPIRPIDGRIYKRKEIPCLSRDFEDEESLEKRDHLTEEDLDHLGVRRQRWHAEPGFELSNLFDD